MKRKAVYTFFSLLMCITVCTTIAFAAEVQSSNQIKSCGTSLAKSSDGKLNILLTISATEKMDVLGASSVLIQRYDGANWHTEYTVTPQNTPEIQVNGKSFHTLLITYSQNMPQSTYRAVVNFYARGSLGVSVATRIAQ